MLQLKSITPKLHPNHMVPFLMPSPDMDRVRELRNDDRREALEFLSIRPVHTVVMTSFINDNGIVSDLNRGIFYGSRGPDGKLDGVALIGHTTLVEARSEQALIAFAVKARTSKTPIHIIMSADNDADRFWTYFDESGSGPRLRCEELLFEARFPFLVQDCEYEVRNADASQLIEVAEAQAEVAFAESGVNPMARDREGFLKRVMRRIEQGRVYSVFENGKLVFKADIIAQTDDVIYLEGVYVGREFRGKGVGSACLAALTTELMGKASHVCLLSNVDFHWAHRSFEKAGYASSDKCVTLFV